MATHDVLRLASYRSKPVAELGFALLKRRSFSIDDVAVLLPLVQAESAAVRPSLMHWLRETLSRFEPSVRPEWVLEFLDSKHADVRAIGWEWLNTSTLKDDPAIWHRLIESPYDDIRGPLVASLAERERGADVDAVRLLWASVLLNVSRGGRYKPGVVARVVDRLTGHPTEADRLVPLWRSLCGLSVGRSSGRVCWYCETHRGTTGVDFNDSGTFPGTDILGLDVGSWWWFGTG